MSEALDRTVAEWRAKVAATGMRAWPEWKAAPDTAIPEKIKSRVILVWGRVCYLTGAKIVGKPPWKLLEDEYQFWLRVPV